MAEFEREWGLEVAGLSPEEMDRKANEEWELAGVRLRKIKYRKYLHESTQAIHCG